MSVIVSNKVVLNTKKARKETLDGRPHTVVPIVLMRNGVHTANAGPLYYSDKVNADRPERWNYMPLVVYHPEVNGKRVGWDRAIRHVARKFADTIARHGPDSVAFYVSGQLLTEDYYVANKLMKGFIGSGNIDTNSRLCMSSAVAGHIRAFGQGLSQAGPIFGRHAQVTIHPAHPGASGFANPPADRAGQPLLSPAVNQSHPPVGFGFLGNQTPGPIR